MSIRYIKYYITEDALMQSFLKHCDVFEFAHFVTSARKIIFALAHALVYMSNRAPRSEACR